MCIGSKLTRELIEEALRNRLIGHWIDHICLYSAVDRIETGWADRTARSGSLTLPSEGDVGETSSFHHDPANFIGPTCSYHIHVGESVDVLSSDPSKDRYALLKGLIGFRICGVHISSSGQLSLEIDCGSTLIFAPRHYDEEDEDLFSWSIRIGDPERYYEAEITGYGTGTYCMRGF